MASELYVGVKIGAMTLASFGSAMSGAKNTLTSLGRTTDDLKARHLRMGQAMGQALTHPMRNVGALRTQYEVLGRTVDRLNAKQIALAAGLAKNQSLAQSRGEIKAGIFDTVGTAMAVGAPVAGAVRKAASFEAGLRDIAITGNLDKKDEMALGTTIRKSAQSTAQGHAAILEAVGTLVAAGMDANKAGSYSALLGKTATATNADMKDLAGMVYSLSETLGIKGEKELKEAFNRAAYGGKLGRFELKDMAKALPEMTAAFASKGIKGQEALTQIIASLEVGREGAGSGEEAVTNLRNWLSHMNAKHTIDAYSKAGVDYQKSMSNLVAGGYSSYEGSLEIAQKFIASRGDAFMQQWKTAGAKGDEEAQRKLMESFGLNEVFQDIQTINHLLAMRQNWDKYQSNKKEMGSDAAMKTIDQDYAKRLETAATSANAFKTEIADLGISVGTALLPALTEAMTAVTPMIRSLRDFATAHPGVIRAVVGMAAGILGMKAATLGLGWGLNFFVKSPLNMMRVAFTTVTGRFALFRALLLGGGSRLATVFQLFGMGASGATRFAGALMTAGRFLLPFGRGLVMSVLGPMRLLVQGSLFLGRILGGSLITGIRLAGQAVLWLGRALMLNPIGLVITAIGIGAYLIWKNWATVKSAVLAGWNWLKGLKNQFFSAGADLINGLVGGVTAKLSAARDAIVGFGSSIKGWFTSTLGIKSPSRVFMGFGDNIAQGAALGVGRSSKQAVKAAGGMANDMAVAASMQRTQGAEGAAGGAGAAGRGAGAAAGIQINFNPIIQLAAGTAESVRGQVNEAMNLSVRELEKMIERVIAEKSRRAY